MLSRSIFSRRTETESCQTQTITSQVLFATLTHGDQIKLKPVNCLVNHGTVLPSLKDDCHPGLAHFANDQFPIRKDKEGEKLLL